MVLQISIYITFYLHVLSKQVIIPLAVSRFCYHHLFSVKIPKADVINKDLVRCGFRSVRLNFAYSFTQAAAIKNYHLISCFRFQECLNVAQGKGGIGIYRDNRKEN